MTTIIELFVGYAVIILIVFLLAGLIPSKTRRYRRELTDLYVAGKIRQLAEKDKVDLDKEYRVFRKYSKKRRAEERALDDTIEMEMQDKIVDNKEEPKKQ